MMEQLTKIVSEINGFLWGMYCLIPLLCGVGIYFTLKLDFIQIRRFGLAVKSTFGGLTLHGERAGKQGMSSFQSLATAIAAQVGTGNLAGAATAIAMGGPGAIFWMWIAAFFGMATIFAEAVLAQTYKTTDDQGHVTGGPAYYISARPRASKKRPAAFFSIAIIIALGLHRQHGPVQLHRRCLPDRLFPASAAHRRNHLRARRASCSSAAWGASAAFYRKGRAHHGGPLPARRAYRPVGQRLPHHPSFEDGLRAARSIPAAATGGIIGAGVKEAMRYGVARGLFSNEAGMGSTPHAHAVAKVKYPAEQGFVAIVGVFVDTFIVLTYHRLRHPS